MATPNLGPVPPSINQVRNPKFKFTRSNLEKITPPVRGQKFYFDSELQGFGLRVTTNQITFIVERKLNGKCCRRTIGPFPVFPPEMARKQAQELLLQMATGIDPKKRKSETRPPTLKQVFEAYLEDRNLKPLTLKDYKRLFSTSLRDWEKSEITAITKSMVEEKYRDLGCTSKARANNAMRVLRAVFNYSIAKYEDDQGEALIKSNPVSRISKMRAWYPIKRRTTVITQSQLKPWLLAVLALKDEKPRKKCLVIRDYLITLLFFGFRRTECSIIKWAEVDMAGKTLTLRDTKNGDDHTLPIPERAFQFLVINNKATKVPPTHTKALLAKMKSSDLLVRLKNAKIAFDQEGINDVDIVNSDSDSPFHNSISWTITEKDNRIVQATAIEYCLEYLKGLHIQELEERDVARDVFLAIWKAVKACWPALWKAKSRLISKVGVICLTRYVIDRIVAWSDNELLDIEITDLEQIDKLTLQLIANMDAKFWTASWAEKAAGGFDTTQGRERVYQALTTLQRNGSKDLPWFTGIDILEKSEVGS